MNISHNLIEAARVNTELILLREDALRVQSPNIKIQILNQIAQKETRLNMIRGKFNHPITQNPIPEPAPSSENKRKPPTPAKQHKKTTKSKRR